MSHLIRTRTVIAIALALGLTSSAAGTKAAEDARDIRSDTWAATDALGRTLFGSAEVGPPRSGKFVGIFYFLWLGQAGDLAPFDISRILAQDPSALTNPASPRWGPILSPHHWGESIFGYYVSEDESVLRKHAQMLANAGVDAVFFDVTNQLTYPRSWKALCRVFDRVKREGNRAPQIAFLCPFGDPRKVVRELWDDLYGPRLYPDLWFQWEGKPLILADYYQLVASIRRYKGARAVPPVEPRPIQVDGRFDNWNGVQPEFRDTIGDPVRRDHAGWGKNLHYRNTTGRNDIVAAKVSLDRDNAYFYVRTQENLTPQSDANWMLLFIDSDNNPRTGWLGYDLVVNRRRAGVGKTLIEKNVGGTYEWNRLGEVPFARAPKELELAVPLSALGASRSHAVLDFKWADNIQQTGDWSDFTLNGDAAPDDRFNYRAVTPEPSR